MYIETKLRSIVKSISFRIWATITSILIVYIFFKRWDLAIATGIAETVIKIFVYYFHERAWSNIKFGKKRIEPFVIWITGLPLSGKTTIGDLVYKKIKKLDKIPIQRLDSKEIRTLIPEVGYTREERVIHLKRIGYLIKTLQSNSISVVASFVSPYKDSRNFIRKITENFIEVYLKSDVETCKKRDYKGVYEKAEKGILKNFTGISDVYEEPESAEIVIDTTKLSPEEASNLILKYIKKNFGGMI